VSERWESAALGGAISKPTQERNKEIASFLGSGTLIAVHKRFIRLIVVMKDYVDSGGQRSARKGRRRGERRHPRLFGRTYLTPNESAASVRFIHPSVWRRSRT